MAQVSIRDVCKSFGSVEVMHDVHVDISDGEFVVLVGPSGCGKSTLLRMVAGLETISAGTIAIEGKVVNNMHPKDRNIAMVFQNYALYPQMTVAQNMGFALELAGKSKAEITNAVGDAATILDLHSYLDRKPGQLSGGQRQRVAMGRAIVRDPKVFLFDEPLSNLDAKLRVHMRAEIKALHQRLGATILYVTHDQIEAMTMADKIVVLNAGRVEQIGSPLDLYDRPANRFVAGFIGSPAMNFVEVSFQNGGVEIAGGGMVDIASAAHGKAILGIRPEHISLSDSGMPDGGKAAQGVAAEVVNVEPTGSETYVALRLVGSGETIMVAERSRRPLQPGEIRYLHFDPDHLHLFDCDSGERIK
ncbi:ABC transporter ATP-binding protein [Cohaesibacter celericrescens]|uniref:Sugar ABC transporter ATP-binding protein n=1 Tax=Cohaesibacter celericrescens TaxID=2067669 RepID=A0A2N5XK64_9HYPH|nr:sn-glycerol-3-phosphate ABC transporter ATP-binding protein UgpC [Cohaesibacter celericrescens]PLW74817.1 sugar ABC transporter ATP-binding protein [Cohaesibacter celericrescens]